MSDHKSSEQMIWTMIQTLKPSNMVRFFFISFLLHFACADGFVPKCRVDSGAWRRPTFLFGISEWRKENTGSELLLLPTSLDKMMLPGQSVFFVIEEESLMGMLTSVTTIA